MPRPRWILGLVAALCCATAPVAAQDDTPLHHEVRVPLDGGRVDVAVLVRELLGSYGLDGDAVPVPSRHVDLRGLRGHLLLLGCRKLLLDTVRFRRVPDADVLVVTVDRERARAVRRELRSRVVALAGRLTGEDLLARSYRLALPDPLDRERPLVVLVHGIENGPEVFADLRAHLDGEDLQVATFAYPDDGSCERAAAELAEALAALGDQRVRLVGYSMGGLVARAAVEDPDLDPGNVDVLVMIGTPNHGSSLAGLRFVLEAAHLLRDRDDVDGFAEQLLEGLRQNLLDGLGEAGGDLLPGSVFLTRMDRLERNPDLRYHLVLGTRGVLSEDRLDTVRARVRTALAEHSALRVVRPKVDAWLGDLREVVDGAGDGAVAVARGRLDGVEPVLVDLDHVGLVRRRGLLGVVDDPAEHPVFVRVAEWVR